MTEVVKMSFKRVVQVCMFKPELMAQLVDQKGEAFIIKLPTTRMVVLSNPDYVKHILVDNPKNFLRYLPDSASLPLHRVLGRNGLNAIDDLEQWRKNRTTHNFLFQTEELNTYSDLMAQSFTKVIEKLEPLADGKTPVNMDEFYVKAILIDLIASLFCGVKVDIDPLPSLQAKLIYLSLPHIYLKRIKFLGLIPVPPFYFRYQHMLKQLDEVVYDVVKQSFGDDVPDYNFVKHIIKMNNYNNFDQLNKETRQYLYDETTNFLFAGHETLSALLGRISVYLSYYPMIAEKLQQEADQVLGGRVPTPEDLKKLPYTLAVIQEGLRLQPPALAIMRRAINDDNVGGISIKKNDLIILPIFAMQRSRKYWDNPEGFDPSRFLKPLTPEQHFVFLGFGVGERMCIGNNFALLHGIIILSMMMSRYRLELLPGALLKRDRKNLINRIKNLTMTVHKRVK